MARKKEKERTDERVTGTIIRYPRSGIHLLLGEMKELVRPKREVKPISNVLEEVMNMVRDFVGKIGEEVLKSPYLATPVGPENLTKEAIFMNYILSSNIFNLISSQVEEITRNCTRSDLNEEEANRCLEKIRLVLTFCDEGAEFVGTYLALYGIGLATKRLPPHLQSDIFNMVVRQLSLVQGRYEVPEKVAELPVGHD